MNRTLFPTEQAYRVALKTLRDYDLTWGRLVGVAGVGGSSDDETALFQDLLGRVLPAFRSSLDMPNEINALSNAIRSVTDWRETHLNQPVDATLWGPVFEAAQAIARELFEWQRVYPTAYAESYLNEHLVDPNEKGGA